MTRSSTPDQVLPAALEEFLAAGFEGGSINRIIDASPLSRATVYKHYGSKLDLFFAAVGQALAEYAAGLPPPSADPDTYWDAVARELAAGIDHGRAEPERVRLLRDGVRVAREHAGHATAKAIIDGVEGRAAWWIQAGQRASQVRDDLPLPLLTDLTVATIEALDRNYLDTDRATPTRDAAAHYVDALRRLLEPRP